MQNQRLHTTGDVLRMGIFEAIKVAFDKQTMLFIVGGVIGSLGVLTISNALQNAPNLLGGVK